MKRLALLILLGTMLISANGQVADAWLSMPDTVCPFLSEQQKLTMLQYAKAQLTDTISNQLEGKSYIDSIDIQKNYLSVQLTPNLHLELSVENDSIHIVETICAPICSSTESWYDFAWNFLRRTYQPWSIEQSEEERLQHF